MGFYCTSPRPATLQTRSLPNIGRLCGGRRSADTTGRLPPIAQHPLHPNKGCIGCDVDGDDRRMAGAFVVRANTTPDILKTSSDLYLAASTKYQEACSTLPRPCLLRSKPRWREPDTTLIVLASVLPTIHIRRFRSGRPSKPTDASRNFM